MLTVLAIIALINDKSIYSNNPFTDKIRLIMSFIMMFDIFIHVVILGPRRYLSLKWSIINVIIAGTMTGWSIYIYFRTTAQDKSNHLETAHIVTR